ncbi:MAG: hypothetical protein NWF08_08680, partial [Candidatus Bathyarchaeota archaeon]|nr:hypothetical protein [Candidatus Bathyarchaeota archaeon]
NFIRRMNYKLIHYISSNLSVYIFLGFIQLIIYSNIYLLQNLSTNTSEYVRLFLLSFIVYFISIVISLKINVKRKDMKFFFISVFIFSGIYRALLVFVEPTLSEDIFRYYWDGKLLVNGVNPYFFRSSAHELDWLRNTASGHHDFQNTFTVYPPIAQLFFGFIYLISGDNFLGMKITTASIDFINGVLITVLYFKIYNRLSLTSSIIYCWSPLLITEFSISGHVDSLTIFFLLVSFLLLHKRMFKSSTVLYALSCWTKFFPLFLFPLIVSYLKKQGQSVKKIFLWFSSVSIILLFPVFNTSGFNLINQILWYHTHIVYNPSIFFFVKNFIWNFQIGQKMILFMRILFLGAYLAIITKYFYAKKQIDFSDLMLNCLYVLGLYFIFAAAVFQWYLSWIILFCALIGLNKKTLPWIIFSGAVVLAYLPQFSTKFDLVGIALIEYLPLYFLLWFAMSHKFISSLNITNKVRR